MKVVVDRLAWLPIMELTPQSIAVIQERLTLKPRVPAAFKTEEDKDKVIQMWEDGGSFLGVPRSWFIQNSKQVHAIEDMTEIGQQIHLTYSGRNDGPYAEQLEAIEEMKESLTYTPSLVGADRPFVLDAWKKSGIIKAAPAWGKTSFGCRLIALLGRKTLVVVHRDFLLDQWKKRIEQFLPGARVGIIKGDKWDTEDKDIVIGMVETLCNHEVPAEVADEFGVVIFDEVHRVGAMTWSKVPAKFRARFRFGLSAKVRRADGCENVFYDHIGPIIYTAKTEPPKPTIRILKTGWTKPSKMSDTVEFPTILNVLAASRRRNTVIATEILNAVQAKTGRKVIVLSERRKQLEILRDLVDSKELDGVTTSFYWPEMKEEEKRAAERCRILFATFQLLEEAFDLSALDVLVLASPKSDVDQSIGRSRRYCEPEETKCAFFCPWKAGKCKGKPELVVIDPTDDEPKCKEKEKWRRAYYKENEMKIFE
jgi:superfamily II DNA or RNA helicase